MQHKILSNMILKRLTAYTEEKIQEYQYGFRKNRSINDQTFVIRQIIEKCYKYNTDLYILFIEI